MMPSEFIKMVFFQRDFSTRGISSSSSRQRHAALGIPHVPVLGSPRPFFVFTIAEGLCDQSAHLVASIALELLGTKFWSFL